MAEYIISILIAATLAAIAVYLREASVWDDFSKKTLKILPFQTNALFLW